jgi:hypothetical protein
MGSVGVGKPANLKDADMVITSFQSLLAVSLIEA